MDITRNVVDGVLEIGVVGRLDGYWADYLDRVLAEAIRDGHHRVTVDCDGLVFLSSAGIAVLMKFHKELQRISGGLQVVRPSAPVRATLKMTRLDALLVAPLPLDVSEPAAAVAAEQFERDGTDFDAYPLPSAGPMTCTVVGHTLPLGRRAAEDLTCVSLDSLAPTFALGIGAFGENVQDCRGRFGELVSVAGATAYQPGDGTNVPDYLVASGKLASSVHVLGCLACDGTFSHVVRFDTLAAGSTIGLSRVIDACFDASDAAAIGICAIVEVAGLVGAALRRSPVEALAEGEDFFAHPGVRARLAFTAEPAFKGSVALIAGVATRAGSGGGHERHLRPMGANILAHLHAAAFRFRPIAKAPLDLGPAVSTLFEPDRLLGVLHLLHDDRAATGSGETQCYRGACWVGPLADDWRVAASPSC